MSADIFWLASYPRSGNTWMRCLIHSYLAGEALNSAQIAATVPDLHVDNEFDPENPSHRIVKTHFPRSRTHTQIDRTAGVIYLIRHPRDILLSSLDFHRVLETKTNTGKLTDRPFAELFLRSGGDPIWISQGFGTWADNARSWCANPTSPLVLVRYEDMREDAARELRRVLELLGEDVDDARVKNAVRLSSFDQMRAMEVREKVASTNKNTFFGGSMKTMRKGHYFMAEGRVGGTLQPIAPGLDAALDERFGEALREFGYA